MATSGTPSQLSQGNMSQLSDFYEELPFDELLELDEPWTVKDVPMTDVNRVKGVMNQLNWANAIEKTGERCIERDDPSRKSRRINEYRITEAARRFLSDYAAQRDTLPCGHRAHVHHRDNGGFGCQYCDAEFDREQVEEAMP